MLEQSIPNVPVNPAVKSPLYSGAQGTRFAHEFHKNLSASFSMTDTGEAFYKCLNSRSSKMAKGVSYLRVNATFPTTLSLCFIKIQGPN